MPWKTQQSLWIFSPISELLGCISPVFHPSHTARKSRNLFYFSFMKMELLIYFCTYRTCSEHDEIQFNPRHWYYGFLTALKVMNLSFQCCQKSLNMTVDLNLWEWPNWKRLLQGLWISYSCSFPLFRQLKCYVVQTTSEFILHHGNKFQTLTSMTIVLFLR